MRVEDVEVEPRLVHDAQVRADARLLQLLHRVDARAPVRDVVRLERVVMRDAEVALRDHREARRVERRDAQLVGVRREVVGLVGVTLARRVERAMQHGHEPLELRLAVGRRVREVRAQRGRLDLLQADHVRERVERGQRARDALHRLRGARDAARAVTEVADVVRDDAYGRHRASRL